MRLRGLKALVLALSLLGTNSCREATANTSARAAAAEANLFRAMRDDDFDAAGDIVGEFYELRDADPTNHRNTFLLGASAFWWIAEAGRPNANALMIIRQAIPIILEAFPDVILNDEENRPGAEALLGAFLADAGFDKVQGSALIEKSVLLAPEIGLFQRMHIRRFAAADDSLTEQSIQAGFAFFEQCAGHVIDHVNPDFTAYVKPPTSSGFARFCWGSERVPHGYEGAWMIFGDLLVKSGRLAAARRAYLNAQLGPNYASWKYKSVLEQRLVENLTLRYATYADHDPNKWASIGHTPFSCTQCHASSK